MDYFMHYVRSNKYIKQLGESARPLIREALLVLHRLEFSTNDTGMIYFLLILTLRWSFVKYRYIILVHNKLFKNFV